MKRADSRRQRGFSLMELLVTIVLAGIVFSAMVPLFVDAIQRNASDSFRNIALNIAREKMEKIRQLHYDQIEANPADKSANQSTPNLYDPAFVGGQFGPTESSYSSSTNSRNFTIDYSVVVMHDAGGFEEFKQVSVDVYWTGNPSPVKHARLQTFIYRQYAGPRINTFSVTPLQQASTSDGLDYWYINAKPVTLGVLIDPNDIANTYSVTFMVLDNNGQQVFQQEIVHLATDATNSGIYGVTWNPAGYRDGNYTFVAVATAGMIGAKGAGIGKPFQNTYILETGPPDAPAGLTATSLASSIKLTWTPSPASDISYYTLYRRVDGDMTWHVLADNLAPITATAGYLDTGVSLGHTYHYALCATDSWTPANVGPLCTAVNASLTPPADTTAPTAPTNVVATKVPNTAQVNLTWTASTDDVGVDHYNVYRATSSTATWTSGWQLVGQAPASVSPTYSDTGVANTTTYYYRIVAYDAAGNPSGTSPSYGASNAVTTDAAPPPPSYSISVTAVNNYSGSGNPSLVVQLYSGSKSGAHTLVGTVTAAKGKKGGPTAWSVVAGPVYTYVTFNGVEQVGKEQAWTNGSVYSLTVTYP